SARRRPRFSAVPGLGGTDYRKEIGRLKARAADKSAVDIGKAQNVAGIGRLYRASVKDAHTETLGLEVRFQLPADVAVHLRYFGAGRRLSGPDRPDRFVGDHRRGSASALRNAAGELSRNHLQCLTTHALVLGLADADDGDQPRAVCRTRL